ncbi:RHS repeat-associated core domain-containing protein, partial [Paracidovorax konjaci]
AFGETAFIWEGMRLIEERRGAQVASYVYEPGSYVPLARIDADGNRLAEPGPPAAQPGPGLLANPLAAPGSASAETQAVSRLPAASGISYFHTDPSGLPEEVTDEGGQVRWRASYRTWGSAIEERWDAVRADGSAIPAAQQRHVGQPLAQNLRLQGQYLDRETGLHYNTFRYYDPDMGRFISPDPIGLAGGLNLQQYAPNPTGWTDPWGWAAGLWGGDGQPASFGDWFNQATPEQVSSAMENPTSQKAIKAALRGQGGAHEWFPVSEAAKAKQLGFSYEELMRMSSPRDQVWFDNVPDPKNPGGVLSGPHSTGAKLPAGQSGRASSAAHSILSAELRAATSKADAIARIKGFSARYVRGGAAMTKGFC